MRAGLSAAAALIAVLAARAPGRADDAAALRAALAAASANVNSFVIVMHARSGQRLDGTLTIVRPGSVHSEIFAGAMSVESFVVDQMIYVHVSPGDSWRKMAYDPAQLPQPTLDILAAAKTARLTPLADRNDGGTTVGAFRIDTQFAAAAGMLGGQKLPPFECTYGKASYLLATCANSIMSMTFTKYNDPANVVVLPPEAKGAVLMVIRTPAPAASASAAAATAPPGASQAAPTTASPPSYALPSPSQGPPAAPPSPAASPG